MNIKTKEPKDSDWSRFVNGGLVNWTEENQSNVKYDFPKMSKMFGLSYIYWLELQYNIIDNDSLKFDEVCKWNGNVPSGFFNKFK